jgi:hypothetical protein
MPDENSGKSSCFRRSLKAKNVAPAIVQHSVAQMPRLGIGGIDLGLELD